MKSNLELLAGSLNTNTSRGRRSFRPALIHKFWVTKEGGTYASCVEIESDGSNGYHFGFTVPEGMQAKKGDLVLVGVDGFSFIGFVLWNGVVVRNMTDEAYDDERQRQQEKFRQDKIRTLEANRATWEARESYLSESSRARIQYFRENSEDDFDLEGWGDELVIGELTDMLVESNLEETDEIKKSDAYLQCSGNQFDIAKALAREIIAGNDIVGTIGGLSPLTGKAFY